MEIRRSGCAVLLGLALLALAAAPSVRAAVPGEVSFQGLLLDSAGAPLTGTVTLGFALFEAATGGAALWSESHPGVAVQDGVYQVALGSSAPLPPEVLAGGSLWLEVEVEGELLAPRQRLLAVPYALRAAEAENAGNVNGLSALFVTEIFEHFNWDGANPPANDPREGLADVDGDGLANFIDGDNDNDGFSDSTELNQGSNLNLVTPRIFSLVPTSADAFAITTVTISGQNFQPGLSVQFGTQSPAPQSLTPTSFQVVVGPQTVGVASVTVTLPNGESRSSSFNFIAVTPSLASLDPQAVPFDQVTTFSATGSNFAPGMTAQVGSQSLTAYDVTATSLKLDVGPQPIGSVLVQVIHPNGAVSNTLPFLFIDPATARRVFLTSIAYKGNLGGIAGADARCNSLAVAAGRSESYIAWLADATTSPAARLPQDKGPYVLVQGTVVAASWADLTDGTLLVPITRSESGVQLGGGSVWTNVAIDGTAASAAPSSHCGGWVSNASFEAGGTGNAGLTTAGWTQPVNLPCSINRSLYCFEMD